MAPKKQPKLALHNSYAKLRVVWYRKLKKSGFKDIETNDFNLKTNSNVFAKERTTKSWEAKSTYYYLATHFLNEFKFNKEIDKIIWEYHSNGISVRNIVKLLNKVKFRKFTRDLVWRTIKKHSSIMKQMYLKGNR